MHGGGHRPEMLQAGSLQWEISRLTQRLNNVVCFGPVLEADYKAGKVRVKAAPLEGVGDPVETDWLPWMTMRAGKNRTWVAPEVGEQVMVLSPNGNLCNGVVIMGLNYHIYPHEADNPDMEKEVWVDHDSAWLEFNRANWVRRFWINEKGTFAWNIADASDVVMDKEHIQLRVGQTKLVIKDGSITMHVNDSATELLITPEHILGHVNKKGVLEVKETQIQSSVDGKGFHKVLADMVESSIEANGYHRVKIDSVESELIKEEVRQILNKDTIKAMIKEALMELTPTTAEVRVPGSRETWEAGKVTLETPAFDGVQASAAPNEFAPGTAPEVEVPAIEAPPAPKALPAHTVGNLPTYPRGDKQAE
jgi:phage baseplate assembly protein V